MSDLKHVLLITYYWPPAGGAGVHRWLRMSKFFKENGYQLHVYCPDNAAWPTIDSALNDQVSEDLIIVRRPIFEPHKYLGKKNNPNVGAGITQQKKSSLLQKFIIWVRGNLFIPDARKFWINPSKRFLKNYLKKNTSIQTVISTGPPHSTHLIALGLKKKLNIHWVADFRDPWTDIDFYQDLLPGKWADKKHHRLENEVLTTADHVVTVSDACASGLEAIANRKVEVITNGFIFPEFDEREVSLENMFTISHFGSMPFARNPQVLWEALALLKNEKPSIYEKIRVQLVGPVDFNVINAASELGVDGLIEHIPSVSHAESLQLQRKTPILLLVANNTGNVKGILTGKFFEYLGAKRPIIAIGESDSNLAEAISITESGSFICYKEVEKLKAQLVEYYTQYVANNLFVSAKNLDQYNSKHLAKEFTELL